MPNSAKAMARWHGWASSFKIAWATGCSPPPVRPCTARKQISTARLGASPQASELTLKPAMQASRNRLRPSTVDSQPESGSTIALVTR